MNELDPFFEEARHTETDSLSTGVTELELRRDQALDGGDIETAELCQTILDQLVI